MMKYLTIEEQKKLVAHKISWWVLEKMDLGYISLIVMTNAILDGVSVRDLLPHLTKEFFQNIPMNNILDDISADDVFQIVPANEIVRRIDVDEIAEMRQWLDEKEMWLKIEAADSAQARITLLEEMSDEMRPMFVAAENRDRLFAGIDDSKTEQAVLQTWLENYKD